MNKVFVVLVGHPYEGYEFRAVYANRKDAMAAVEIMADRKKSWYWSVSTDHEEVYHSQSSGLSEWYEVIRSEVR